MCQMRVVLEQNDKNETIIEEVTKIEISDNGLILSTFFDEPKFIDNAMVKEIDCLGSTVIILNKEELDYE